MGVEQLSMKNVARRNFEISAPAASHAPMNAAERLYMAVGGSALESVVQAKVLSF
jgi:hypothetical protein